MDAYNLTTALQGVLFGVVNRTWRGEARLKGTGVAASMGFALRVSPSPRDRRASPSGAERCAEPGVPAKSRWLGAGFVGWDGAPNVPDKRGVPEGGTKPPPCSLVAQVVEAGPAGGVERGPVAVGQGAPLAAEPLHPGRPLG